MASGERYAEREEAWGGLVLDRRRDRIWSFDHSTLQEFRHDPCVIERQVGKGDPFCYTGSAHFGSFPEAKQFTLTAPISVSWVITLRCQSACIFCCTNSHAEAAWGADLDTITAALDKLSRWGVLRLIAGGGEPLMRPDIEHILAHAAGVGLAPSLATNGLLLDAATARRLAPHVMQFQISLDSVRSDEYAALRGKAGGPDLVRAAIEHASDQGHSVRVVTVLNARNLPHLEEVAEAVDRSSATQWFIFVVQPAGRGARTHHKLGLTDCAAVRRRVADIKRALRPGLAVCFWGDEASDGIAVYLTESCRLILKDYGRNSSVDLDPNFATDPAEGFRAAWQALDRASKHATLRNFVSANRVL